MGYFRIPCKDVKSHRDEGKGQSAANFFLLKPQQHELDAKGALINVVPVLVWC